MWRESFLELAYEVIDSPTLPKGIIINVGFGSMLYRIKGGVI